MAMLSHEKAMSLRDQEVADRQLPATKCAARGERSENLRGATRDARRTEDGGAEMAVIVASPMYRRTRGWHPRVWADFD